MYITKQFGDTCVTSCKLLLTCLSFWMEWTATVANGGAQRPLYLSACVPCGLNGGTDHAEQEARTRRMHDREVSLILSRMTMSMEKI